MSRRPCTNEPWTFSLSYLVSSKASRRAVPCVFVFVNSTRIAAALTARMLAWFLHSFAMGLLRAVPMKWKGFRDSESVVYPDTRLMIA